MKNHLPSLLLSILGSLSSTLLFGNVYFVSPQGNDNNPGTQNAPFQSWQHAHDKTQPGDTVWIRGGIYPITHGGTRGVNMVGHNGTPQKRIYFWAWPGEKPVLDCSGMSGSGSLYGVYFENDWWHLKGLEISGVPMNTTEDTYPDGFWGEDCENDIFENLDIHHNQGRGFGIYDASRNNLVLNCDFHHNYDFKTPDAPGGNADGGGFLYLAEGMSGNIMRGCRAWANSDDGFDFWESNSGVTIEHCWSFRNGYVPDTNLEAGNGSGFKMGQNSSGAHLLHHCLSFENRVQGFDDNLAGTPQQWYNNTAFNNGSHNFRVVAAVGHFLRNNVAFPDNNTLDQAVKQDKNAWNLPIPVDNSDFLSIVPTGAEGPRNADGSLPDLDFLKLAASSDLIDKGANVGLPFSGNAPDLGANESVENQGAYPQSFSPHGPGGGGYTYVPSISPHDPNHIFLNCDMGGVYRSQDGAQHWQMQHYQDVVSHVKGKIQFTSDPNILYVCRRSTSNHDDPLYRGELAKSTDGGASWQPLADPTASGVHRLEVDPASTQRLLANEYNRLFFSSDGGANWSEIYQPPSGNMWIGGVFWDGANIYIGTNEGLLVSKNNGISFAIENHSGLPSGTGIYQLSGAKSGATTRLFCLAVASDELYAWNEPLGVRGKLQGIFRMNYTSSASWTNSRGNIPTDVEIAWVDLALNNTQTVWAAGANSNSLPQIFKSTNGGQAWTNTYLLDNNQNVSTGWAGQGGAFWLNYNESALGFEVSPTDANRVIFSDGNGHITTDGGLNWRATYVDPAYQNPAGQSTPIQKTYKSSGLDVTTAHHIFWVNDQEMFVSNTDIGQTYSADGGETWTFAHNFFQPWGSVSDNNWYHIVRQSATGHLFAATSGINDIYLSYRITDEVLDNQHGFVGKSTDNGAIWDTIYNFGHPVVWLETDKSNPAKIYASVVHSTEGGIFQSSDGGVSWTKLPNPPRTHGHPYNIVSLADGSLVATYSAHALSDGVTLTESSGVFLLPPGSNNWLDRTAAAMKFYTKDLIVDPHDPTQNTWYATVWGRFTTFAGPNNQGNGGLYRTTDRGQSWARVYANEMAESISIHPTQAGTAYLSAENDGLFFTENLGASPSFERVNSFPFWRPKRMFFKPGNSCELWVTTMGGGIWKSAASQSPVSAFDVSLSGLSASFQNNSSNGLAYSWDFGDGQSSTAQNPTHSYSTPGTYTVVLTVSNDCGSQSLTLPVTADCNPPSVEIFTTGVTQICAGEAVEIQVLSLNIANYAWFLNGMPVPGAAGSSFMATQSGIYKVYITDAAGCGNYSNEMTIEVSPLPEANINSPSGGALCAGASTWLTGTGGIAYQWLTPGGFQVSAQVIEIPAAGQTNSGLYQLTVTDGSGCSATTSYALLVNPLPTAAIQPSGTLSVPFGQTLVLDAGAGFTTYQWNNGETTQSLTVSDCGAYQVTVVDAHACSATSPAVMVNVQPIAAYSNGVLLSTPAANYQWFLDGNSIPGANGPTYVPTLSGNYAVQTDCGALGAGLAISPVVPVLISSIFDLNTGTRAYIRVAPNPISTAATELVLELHDFEPEPLVILVSDLLGREVLRAEQPVFAEKIGLKLEESAPGLYWVQVYGGGRLKAVSAVVRGR